MIEPWLPEPGSAVEALQAPDTRGRRRVLPSPATPRTRRPSSAGGWGRLFVLVSAALWALAPFVGIIPVLKAFVILGFAAAAAGLVVPTVGIMGVGLLVALDPLTRVYLLEGGLWRWNTFNYWLLAVMALSLGSLLKERSTSFRLAILLTVWLVCGLAWTTDTTEGIQHLLGLLAFFGLFAYFQRLDERPDAWCWLGLAVGSCTAVGCLVFYGWRGDMPDIDPNAWIFFPLSGMFAVSLALPFAGGRLLQRRGLLALGAVNFVWVFLSGSRGGLLMAASCVVLWVTGASGLRRKVAYGAGVACLVGVILIAFDGLREAAWTRVEKLFDEEQSLALRTSGRSDLVIAGWRIFLDHPAVGVGTGGFGSHWITLRNDQGLSGYGRGRRVDAHAGWVKTLAEGGIVGFLLQAAFVASFATSGWRARGSSRSLGLLVTVVLSVAFLTTEFQGKGLWFLAAGMLTVLRSATQTPARAPVPVRRARPVHPVVASGDARGAP